MVSLAMMQFLQAFFNYAPISNSLIASFKLPLGESFSATSSRKLFGAHKIHRQQSCEAASLSEQMLNHHLIERLVITTGN